MTGPSPGKVMIVAGSVDVEVITTWMMNRAGKSAVTQKIEALFPPGVLPLGCGGLEAPAFEFQPAALKKLILSSPTGLATGCSGLRAVHVKAVLQDRNVGQAARTLDALTKFASMCAAGYLPSELLKFICGGGRLTPLNKKKTASAE